MAATIIRRNTNFWFDDGNIVLNAQGTLFRVHRGIIGRHAQVFKDMTSIPQPQTGQEPSVEGCPLVPLDDDPEDWEHLLNVIYDCNTSSFSKDTWNLPVLTSVLRLGRKYAFDHLYGEALKRVKLGVPSTLETWDEMLDNLYNAKADTPSKDDAIDLLNVLLEFDVGSCLPVGYAICLTFLTVEEVFRGTPRQDGSIARLSAASIETLIVGREKIFESKHFKAFPDVLIPGEDCSFPAGCRRRSDCSPYPKAHSALEPWEDIEWYCDQCKKRLIDHSRLHRQAIWSCLPFYFGSEQSNDAMDR
ncbi:hypothetical protein CVT26_005280 [Gymnopilus dilepis]|uniref:BTB domain-containing protein n=1 Tax=Gymnopilus dilepis TaxID=231916 RepID=A0A409YST9_9AGAR|nr:hypothetical protein CVT26_005280 [Gymnopilus dilepis]